MSSIALGKQLSKRGTLLAAAELAEASPQGVAGKHCQRARRWMEPAYTLMLVHKWNLAHSDWPVFKGVIDRLISKCFCFKKQNKKEERKKCLSAPKLAHTANERIRSGSAQGSLSRSSLGTIRKVTHLFFQISFNCTQGFH